MSDELAGSPIASELRPWVARTVRVGYAAKGLIYLLIGTLAFRLAAGLGGGRIVDPTGALRVIVRQPFGSILIAVLAIGILAYAGWQFVEAIWDTRGKGGGWRGWSKRALTLIKGAAYGTVGWQATRMLFGKRGSQNIDAVVADVISVPLGGVFLFLVGVGITVYGIFEIKDAWHARFGEDLDSRRLRREAGGWAIQLGRIGNGARGVILTIIGTALVAAVERDPSEAGGIADALGTLFFCRTGGRSPRPRPSGWPALACSSCCTRATRSCSRAPEPFARAAGRAGAPRARLRRSARLQMRARHYLRRVCRNGGGPLDTPPSLHSSDRLG